MKRAPRRGDIYWVTFDPVVGSEIRKTRPAVVISNDACNTHGARVVVLPVTSNVISLHPGEARTILAEIYGWFTQGFDTRDLQHARTLLDEL